MFLHKDALSVVAIGVGERVVALGKGLHLVEGGIGDVHVVVGENVGPNLGGINGMGLCRYVVDCTGEDGAVVGGLSDHAAVGIIVKPARLDVAEPYFGQSVEVVVCEAFCQVAGVVGSLLHSIISFKNKLETVGTMDYILSASWFIIPTCSKIRIFIWEGHRIICIKFGFINQVIRTITFR